MLAEVVANFQYSVTLFSDNKNSLRSCNNETVAVIIIRKLREKDFEKDVFFSGKLYCF